MIYQEPSREPGADGSPATGQEGTDRMPGWIAVAVIGLVLAMIGFLDLVRRYRRNEIRGRDLFAIVIGFLSLLSFAFLSAVRPDVLTGMLTIVILLPAFVAVVILTGERPVLR